jgi:hypothetical protein
VYLHGKGAAINNVSKKERTPLMKAALWGRFSIVDYLIANGASKDHKDRSGMNAFDLTAPIARNRIERKRLLIVGQEPPDADDSRRIIGIRLSSQASLTFEMNRLAISLPPQTDGRYVKSRNVFDHTIAYYEHSTDYSVPVEWKTIARLDRGPLFPVISAMSEFSREESPSPVLSNLFWTEKVEALCHLWETSLPPDYRDQGHPGRFHACHAEKQLMTFDLSEHVLLADEMGWEYETGHYTSRLHRKGMKLLQGVWEVQPDVPPREDVIHASSVICASCVEFAV